MREYLVTETHCYLDLVSVTADLLLLLLLRLLADLTVQLVGQLGVVLGLVAEGAWRSQVSITLIHQNHKNKTVQSQI